MDKDIRINGKTYKGVDTIKVKDAASEDLYAFRNTDDANIESKDIPLGKIGYGKDGKVIGSYIQPNGEIDGGINFYDQYGAWLISYSLADLPLSALPEIPVLEGPGADQYEFAWTMTLEEVNALTAEASIGVDVTAKEGAKTYFIPNRLGFSGSTSTMYFRGNGNEATQVLIDWGDGTTSTINISATSSYASFAHTYKETIHNPITIEKISGGDFYFGSAGNSASFMSSIAPMIKEIRFGEGACINFFGYGSSCEKILLHNAVDIVQGSNSYPPIKGFSYLKSLNVPKRLKTLAYCAVDCHSLESIFIPEGVESIGTILTNSAALKSLILPSSCNKITSKNIVTNCPSLKRIKFPKSTITVETTFGMLTYGYAIEEIDASNLVVESLSNYMDYCSSIKEAIIPDGVTSIGPYCLRECKTLESVIIPASVESIDSNFLYRCYGLKQIIMKGSVPPALNSSGFLGDVTRAQPTIYVPLGSLENYATATNWATRATYMVEY